MVFKDISSSDWISIIDDKTFNEILLSSSSSSKSWIKSTTFSITDISDFAITFASKEESSSLSSALSTACSINLLTSVCSSVSKDIDSSDCNVATEDKIFNEILLFSSSSSKSWIKSTSSSITDRSDLIIILASKEESSSLSSALSTACSINLLTSVCSSVSKSIVSSDWIVATEDKIFNEILLFSSSSSKSWIKSTSSSITDRSDLIIILANIVESSSLSSALSRACSINLLTSVCCSSSRLTNSLLLKVATAERTFRDLFVSVLVSDWVWTLSTIIETVSLSDLEIILLITSRLKASLDSSERNWL